MKKSKRKPQATRRPRRVRGFNRNLDWWPRLFDKGVLDQYGAALAALDLDDPLAVDVKKFLNKVLIAWAGRELWENPRRGAKIKSQTWGLAKVVAALRECCDASVKDAIDATFGAANEAHDASWMRRYANRATVTSYQSVVIKDPKAAPGSFSLVLFEDAKQRLPHRLK